MGASQTCEIRLEMVGVETLGLIDLGSNPWPHDTLLSCPDSFLLLALS